MPLNSNLMPIRHWRLPPLRLIAVCVLLQLGLAYVGFFHWLLTAGLFFGIYWARPSREWLAWMLIFIATTFIYMTEISYISTGDAFGLLKSYGIVQIIIGNLLFAPLIMLGVWTLRRRGISMAGASGLKNMANLHGAALFTAFLLMGKDLA